MKGSIARAIRKGTKRDGRAYVRELKGYPFRTRLRFCWFILFGKVTEGE